MDDISSTETSDSPETADTVAAPVADRPLESSPKRQPESNVVRRLDPRYVPFQRTIGWIGTASVSVCLLAAVGILWLTGEVPRWGKLLVLPVWLFTTLGVGWLSYAWPAIHYRQVSYTLDAEGIEIRSGLWWRQVICVPRSRVQHIDVSQGPLERSYGLGRLVLYTAGTEHSRVELPGLSYAVAFALRNHLLPRGGDDAV